MAQHVLDRCRVELHVDRHPDIAGLVDGLDRAQVLDRVEAQGRDAVARESLVAQRLADALAARVELGEADAALALDHGGLAGMAAGAAAHDVGEGHARDGRAFGVDGLHARVS
jgi:hypothetical protein